MYRIETSYFDDHYRGETWLGNYPWFLIFQLSADVGSLWSLKSGFRAWCDANLSALPTFDEDANYIEFATEEDALLFKIAYAA